MRPCWPACRWFGTDTRFGIQSSRGSFLAVAKILGAGELLSFDARRRSVAMALGLKIGP